MHYISHSVPLPPLHPQTHTHAHLHTRTHNLATPRVRSPPSPPPPQPPLPSLSISLSSPIGMWTTSVGQSPTKQSNKDYRVIIITMKGISIAPMYIFRTMWERRAFYNNTSHPSIVTLTTYINSAFMHGRAAVAYASSHAILVYADVLSSFCVHEIYKLVLCSSFVMRRIQFKVRGRYD